MHPNAQLIFGASVRSPAEIQGELGSRGEMQGEIESRGEIVVTAVITRFEESALGLGLGFRV